MLLETPGDPYEGSTFAKEVWRFHVKKERDNGNILTFLCVGRISTLHPGQTIISSTARISGNNIFHMPWDVAAWNVTSIPVCPHKAKAMFMRAALRPKTYGSII